MDAKVWRSPLQFITQIQTMHQLSWKYYIQGLVIYAFTITFWWRLYKDLQKSNGICLQTYFQELNVKVLFYILSVWYCPFFKIWKIVPFSMSLILIRWRKKVSFKSNQRRICLLQPKEFCQCLEAHTEQQGIRAAVRKSIQ